MSNPNNNAFIQFVFLDNSFAVEKEDICGGLGEVINGDISGRENDDEIIVFKTVGIAAQDLITSLMIYEKIGH